MFKQQHRSGGALGFILAAVLFGASAHATDLVVQDRGEDARPELIFACDRSTTELNDLFTPELIADLQQLKAGIALSTEDLSPERAQIVRRLNAAGVPMTAWIALPKSEGYYVMQAMPPRPPRGSLNSTSGRLQTI